MKSVVSELKSVVSELKLVVSKLKSVGEAEVGVHLVLGWAAERA